MLGDNVQMHSMSKELEYVAATGIVGPLLSAYFLSSFALRLSVVRSFFILRSR